MGSIAVSVKPLGTPSVTIEIIRPNDPSNLTLGGPEPIILKAIPSGFAVSKKRAKASRIPEFREIHYEWDWGGIGTTFDAPERLLAPHRNGNRSRDQFSCRVVDPATHTVLVALVDYYGRTAFGVITFTVNPIPSEYVQLVVSTSSNWTGAPTHDPANRFTSISAALDWANTNTTKCRISVRAGETFAPTKEHGLTGANRRVLIDTYGGSANATLNFSQRIGWFLNTGGTNNFVMVSNLDLRGAWDSTKESTPLGNVSGTGSSTTDGTTVGISLVGHGWLVVRRCTADGMETGFRLYNATNGTPSFFICENCSVRNWQNYAYYGASNLAGYWILLGCEGIQGPDALMNGVGKSLGSRGIRNEHASARIQGQKLILIEAYSGHGRGQWSVNGPKNLPPIPQPVLRIHDQQPTSFIIVNRSYIEGAIAWGDATGGAATDQEAFSGARVSESIMALPPRVSGATGTSNGGVCFENNLFIGPDTDWTSNARNIMVDLAGAPGIPEDNQLSSTAFIHNTIVNLQSDANYSGSYVPLAGADFSFFKNPTFANNAVYTPNRADGSTSDGPFDEVPLWEMFDEGFKIGVARGVWDDGLPAAVPNGGTIFIPYDDLLQDWQTSGAYTQEMFTSDPTRNKDHWVRYGGKEVISEDDPNPSGGWTAIGGQISVSFGATGITVTNTSGTTWPAGIDRPTANNGRKFDFGFDHRASPAVSGPAFNPFNGLPGGKLQLHHPAENSGAAHDADQWPRLPRDLLGNLRGPNPSRGCLEPLA